MKREEERLRVELGKRSYDIVIGDGLASPGGSGGVRIRDIAGPRPCWIVTDETVAGLHLQSVRTALSEAGVRSTSIVLPPGERTKNLETVERVANAALDSAPERSSVLIALGGGVVGDIAGFAASMILRGVSFVQIPTTLLSQVDSSVGGKTGVNTRHGKNLLGAFYQPRLVLADTAMLDTLPRPQLLAGYAEVVKYGLIRDPDFFAWLERNGAEVVAENGAARRHAVRTSCAVKADIVGRDEREAGARALLNFGHTFGHAIEAEAGYQLLHGEAVAVGMVMAFELSAALGLCAHAEVIRVRRHFETIGLPVALPANRRYDPDALIRRMSRDKKVRDGRASFVLARAVGDAFVTSEADSGAVRRAIETALPGAGNLQ